MQTLLMLCVGTAFHLAAPPLNSEPPAEWGSRVTWEDEGPAAREHASLMYAGHKIALFAGSGYEPQLSPLDDAWVFDPAQNTWQVFETSGDVPPGGGSKRVAQVNQDGQAYLWGGYDGRFVCNNDLYRVDIGDDALAFAAVEQVGTPPPRALHAFIYDPISERFIVTHGVSQQGFRGDTWLGKMNESGELVWSEVECEQAPAPRFGFAYGFDSSTGTLALFSGQLEPTADNQMPMASDVWVLEVRAEPPKWTQVPIPEDIQGRRNPCFVFDDANDRLAVWCGTADARTNIPGVVWIERKGQEWSLTQLEEGDSPPGRSSGFGFADDKTGDVYFGFGNSATGRYRDWVQLGYQSFK